MDSKKNFLLAAILAAALVGVAVLININYGYNGDNASNISGSINVDNGDTKINWERYPSYNVELSETYKITASGTYYLSGTLTNGVVVIDAGKDAVVKLVLDNVTIKNSNGPAIACYPGDDLVIELIGDNYLEDGDKYSSDWDEDIRSTIYSKADLSFIGDGKLTVKANLEDAIVSKDDLTFRSGTYDITSVDDAIRGKDSVHIEDGTFEIAASGDAIKSTNDANATKGFVLVENGVFDVDSTGKGIKAINSIMLYGGDFEITSHDDAIHSNNYVGITDGKIEISSGDDGIHADARLIIDGGEIDITKAYEGLEAQKISINNGNISIVSSDDGINAGGGADASSNNRAGANPFDADENCEILINGGTVYINAGGDGVDSNGALYFNGGTVTIDGPTNNGNGALDSGSGILMNGGKVIAVGASGMAETLGSSSSIYNVSIYFDSTLSEGTEIKIKNSSGNTIISHTSAKTFNHLSAGTSEFKAGETYNIYLDGDKYDSFTISDITTTVGATANSQNMGPDNMNMGPGNMNMGPGQRR